ncbi:hypothetical protein BDZ45DRAFT_732025 [Acephala macrosclerotiorum]|nr:hypothetical protein BDZ45DRAFT_732025 [Acephala macrosclerotiorum]
MNNATTPNTSVQGSDIASDLPAAEGNATAVSQAGTGQGFPTFGHQQVGPQTVFYPTTGTQTFQTNIANASTLSTFGTNQVATTTASNAVAPVAAHNTAPTLHACNICPNTFKRAGDLRRHYKKHFPSQYIYDCHVIGCDRVGTNGFYRKDKLAHHLKKAHGL